MTTLLLAATLLAAVPAAAADALSARERTCQVARAHTVYRMIVDLAGCIRRCRAEGGADCTPFDGAGVAACAGRVQARTLRRVFGRPCVRDCPECYGGCGPDVAAGEVGYSAGLVAAFAPLVFCEPPAAPAAARCMDAVAAAAGRFAQRYGDCFAACRGRGCDAAGAGDARARACAARAARRAGAAVDARCEPALGGRKPACYGTRDGAGWTALVQAAVDVGRPVLYCASPGGAFLDTAAR